MNTPSANLSVLVGDQFACIKIVGRANFSSSIDFKTLLNELKDKGYSYFVLDLSACTLMDSTFLGVLAGFGLKMLSNQKVPGDPAIELLNPNARDFLFRGTDWFVSVYLSIFGNCDVSLSNFDYMKNVQTCQDLNTSRVCV